MRWRGPARAIPPGVFPWVPLSERRFRRTLRPLEDRWRERARLGEAEAAAA